MRRLESRRGVNRFFAICDWAVAIFCFGTAGWMIHNTLRTFPGWPFEELVPGLVVYPGMCCIIGVFCLGLGLRDWHK